MIASVRRLLVLALLAAVTILAHVGSPDVFFDGVAGPYRLLIAIRPPVVIPGLAQLEVRASTPGIQSMTFLPMPLTGIGSKLPPTADVAARSAGDANLFTGRLWLMDFGSWQVKVHVAGDRGEGDVAVPVPALATGSKGMDKNFGRMLFGMMVFLVVGLVSIVGAAVRESTLAAGQETPPAFRPKSVAVMLVTSALAIWFLYAGNQWWGSEAANYSRKLYRPLDLSANVLPGQKLDLRLSDSRWLNPRRLDDLEPDHGHLMHLYAIRDPGMDAVFHLHPEQVHAGVFALDLPPMPPGKYQLFADIVHESGLGETSTGEMEIATPGGTPLSGDNAGGIVNAGATVSPQPDGTRMVWLRGREAMRTNQVQRFVFRLEAATGTPLSDLEPYMGMAGHAAFVSHENGRWIFAHVHPTGSAPMAALMMAATSPDSMAAMHQMPSSAEISFPYAFPAPGRYRIFVQMKRAGKIVTGAFDANVL